MFEAAAGAPGIADVGAANLAFAAGARGSVGLMGHGQRRPATTGGAVGLLLASSAVADSVSSAALLAAREAWEGVSAAFTAAGRSHLLAVTLVLVHDREYMTSSN